MRVLLATNAESGAGTDPAEVAGMLRGHGAEVETCRIEDLTAGRVTGDRLVVAGGDGSLGVAAVAAVAAGVALAVVPTGTANDFARAAGIPLDPAEAAALAVDARAPVQPFEVAAMDGRPFLNVATAGLSVAAAQDAAPLKPRLGALAYAVGAVKAGVTGDPVRARVDVDGEQLFDDDAWQVAVAATGAFGAGSAVGGTRPDDHRLDVAIVPADSRAALVRAAAAMRVGRLHEQDGVLSARGARVVVRGPSAFNVDGELCESDGTATFEVRAEPVRVVVPS